MCNPLKCLAKRSLLCVICIFNLALSLSGIACIGIGILMLVYGRKFYLIFSSYYSGTFAGSVCLLIGCVLLGLGFIGNISACCGCNVLLYIYGVVLLVVVLFQLVTSIGGITKVIHYDNPVADDMLEWYQVALKKYVSDSDIKYQIDNLHMAFKCCGGERAHEFRDFFDMTTLPKSCCINPNKDCSLTSSSNTKQSYHIACGERFKEFLYSIKSFLGFVIFISFVELLFLVLLCGFIWKFL